MALNPNPGNNVSELPKDVFSRLHKLDVLNLSENKIKFISAETLQPLFVLKHLVLSGNPLQHQVNNDVFRNNKNVPHIIY